MKQAHDTLLEKRCVLGELVIQFFFFFSIVHNRQNVKGDTHRHKLQLGFIVIAGHIRAFAVGMVGEV